MSVAFDQVATAQSTTSTAVSVSLDAASGADVFLLITTDRAAAPSSVELL